MSAPKIIVSFLLVTSSWLFLGSIFPTPIQAQTITPTPAIDPQEAGELSGSSGNISSSSAIPARTPSSTNPSTTSDCTPSKEQPWCPLTSDTYNYTKHSNLVFSTFAHSALCGLTNLSNVDNCVVFQKNGSKATPVVYNQEMGGALGQTVSLVASLYTPPTSSTYYLAHIGEDLGLIAPAYAQNLPGSGASIIVPILSLWQIIRNFAYLLFIIIFLAVGFMIMLRQKINPQTVVSIQAALPGLIIGLILVTFSYFISALIIDLAFVGVQLVTQIFISFAQSLNPTTTINTVFGDKAAIQGLANHSNIFDLFLSTTRVSDNIQEINSGASNLLDSFPTLVQGANTASAIFTGIIGAVAGGIVFGLGGVVLGGAIGGLTGANTTGVVSGIVSLIIPLVLIIALMIQFFKLLFQLINAYISLLITTLISPLVILFSSLPGKGGAISFWWKTLLANTLIFPAVFGAFFFAGIILATDPNDWTVSPPLFGNLPAQLLRLIIAYGIILGTPAIPGMVKAAFGVKDIQGIPQAALGGFMGGVNVGSAGWNAGTAGYKQQAEAYNKQQAAIRSGTAGAGAPGGTFKWYYRLFR